MSFSRADEVEGTPRSKEIGPNLPEDRQRSAALELVEVTKKYRGSIALEGIDLRVEHGEFVTILGPSGSGKTTCLRLIAGFDVPSSGRILLDGRDVSFASPAQRNIGMVFQNYALFPHMSVEDNIAYGLKRRGWPKDHRMERVQDMLSLVRLGGLGSRLPRELSGGQQQRVALARALAPNPKLLLMDEPLGALDRQLRLEMQDEIRRIHREVGATVVYVTHDQEEALSMSDRVAIVWLGRILAFDTAPTLYEKPRSALVARFLSAANLLPVRSVTQVGNGKVVVDCIGSEFTANAPTPEDDANLLLAIRPESFRLDPRGDPMHLRADVKDVRFLGETVHVTCQVGGDHEVVAHIRRSEMIGNRIDDSMDLYVDPSECSLVIDDRP
jgi:putative spermidine/putrescine transport system ATP-binding protein